MIENVSVNTADCKRWCALEKISKNETVGLFSSNLVSGNVIPDIKKPLDVVLQNDTPFEKMGIDNINAPSEKTSYTIALKFKGLEKDLVIVVIKDLFDEKIKTFYQMFIGVSRARRRLFCLWMRTRQRLIRREKNALQFWITSRLWIDHEYPGTIEKGVNKMVLIV